MIRTTRRRAVLLCAAWLALALAIADGVEGCDNDSSTEGGGARGASGRSEDFAARATDFRNLRTMTKVRGFYIDNRRSHLAEALRVANSPKGGTYPVGTIIQLVPQEAMVKRRKGFDPATNDWEFFFLSVSPTGTVIEVRGTDKVVNRFGGNCASCHSAADPKFDFVCEHDHGCAPLPIGDDVIRIVQSIDPRPVS